MTEIIRATSTEKYLTETAKEAFTTHKISKVSSNEQLSNLSHPQAFPSIPLVVYTHTYADSETTKKKKKKRDILGTVDLESNVFLSALRFSGVKALVKAGQTGVDPSASPTRSLPFCIGVEMPSTTTQGNQKVEPINTSFILDENSLLSFLSSYVNILIFSCL